MLEAALRLQLGESRFQFDAKIPLSGVTVLFGKSGSGKTTLLRCLSGLERRTEGTLRVAEVTFQSSAKGMFLAPEKRHLGFVFQQAALFPRLSVRSNLRYAYERARPQRRRCTVEEMAELIGLTPLLDRASCALSGGEQKRVALARALLSFPDLLLMDEPLSGLDAVSRIQLQTTLRRLHEETRVPVIYVTHSMAEVARLADRVLPLDSGSTGPLLSVEEALSRHQLYERGGCDVLSRLDVKLRSFDPEYRIAECELGPDVLRIPLESQHIGQDKRLFVFANDVTLSLVPSERSSVLNSLAVSVEELTPDGPLVLVACRTRSGDRLTAAVTKLATELLELRIGSACFAQFKATAIAAE